MIRSSDCAFSAIVSQMRKTIEWTDRRSWLGNNEDADVLKFRQHFVDKVQSNDHYQMLSGIPSVDLNPGGGVLPGKVCGPFPKTLTLFTTKICNFPYPVYDLT